MHNADSYAMTLLSLARTTERAPAVIAAAGAHLPTRCCSRLRPEGGERNCTARRAIGFAEAWLNYAEFWSPDLYDFIAASLVMWRKDVLGKHLGHVMVELFAPLVQMQRPHPNTSEMTLENSAIIVAFRTEVARRGFPTPPIATRAQVQERTRAAGVYDGFTRMHRRLPDPLVVDRAAGGDGSWATAPGLPGFGDEVRLADSFFSLSPVEQTRDVIRLMARAMADVGAAWVEAYVEAADGVHGFRDLGP